MSLDHGGSISPPLCPGMDDCHRGEEGKKGPLGLLHCSHVWLCSLPEEQNTGLCSYRWSELTDLHHDETALCFPQLGRILFTLNQRRSWSEVIASWGAAKSGEEYTLLKEENKLCWYRLSLPWFHWFTTRWIAYHISKKITLPFPEEVNLILCHVCTRICTEVTLERIVGLCDLWICIWYMVSCLKQALFSKHICLFIFTHK